MIHVRIPDRLEMPKLDLNIVLLIPLSKRYACCLFDGTRSPSQKEIQHFTVALYEPQQLYIESSLPQIGGTHMKRSHKREQSL